VKNARKKKWYVSVKYAKWIAFGAVTAHLTVHANVVSEV